MEVIDRLLIILIENSKNPSTQRVECKRQPLETKLIAPKLSFATKDDIIATHLLSCVNLEK